MPIPIPSRRLLVPACLVALAACGRGGEGGIHELAVTQVRGVESVASAPFGGDGVLGQPLWLSRGGRVALLYLVDEDTDGNGRIEAEFGNHGIPLADKPHLWAFDLRAGTRTRYDELLTIDPTERYAAFRQGGAYVLLDARTGTVTDLGPWGISGRDDANPCLPPRQLGFDGEGRRMAFLRGSPPRLVVRDLATGAERVVAADSGVLWRAGFGPVAGWVQLDVVRDSTAFPELRTTCHSREAMAFAGSYSFGGWDGPAFRSVLVPPRGRPVTVPGVSRLVGTRAYALSDTALRTADGRPVPLPEGCGEMLVFPPAPRVVLQCGDGSVLFDPLSGRATPLPVQLWTDAEEAAVDAQGRHWAAVLLHLGAASETTDRPPEYRLARLRLEDGRIEAGPRVQSVDVSGGRWAGAHDGTAAYALDLRTGRLLSFADTAGVRIEGGLTWRETSHLVAVDLERARSFPVGRAAAAPSLDGCVIEGSREAPDERMQRGPWRRRCPADPPAR